MSTPICKVMVRDHQRRPAALDVGPQQCRHHLRSRRIEVGERLIQQPQRRTHGQDPRHGNAAALPGRQHTGRQIRTGPDTGLFQAGAQFSGFHPPLQPDRETQILQGASNRL